VNSANGFNAHGELRGRLAMRAAQRGRLSAGSEEQCSSPECQEPACTSRAQAWMRAAHATSLSESKRS